MTAKLRTHAAVERAEAEREHAEDKRAAFESFGRRVRSISADGGGGSGGRPSASASGGPSPGGLSSGNPSLGGALAVGGTAGTATSGSAESVREAFRETVLPFADSDDLREAMADELSPDLSAALSPANGGFAPGTRAQLVSRVGERVGECRLLADALAEERDSLREFADELDRTTEWVAEADETPLLQLGFEELRERHDRLAELRETCDDLARQRQASLRETRCDGGTGIRTSEVRRLLYADFADDHPVLADLARLDAVLAECQRSVRRHLCARV